MKEDAQGQKINKKVLRSPIILTGRGGSGTRIISELAEKSGVFLGNRLNTTRDSVEWVDLIYEMVINKLSSVNSDSSRLNNVWENLLLNNAKDVLSQGKWIEGKPWGWKLPETMITLPEVFSTFTDAKLIHLVRHPVDCSLRRTHLTSRMSNPIGRAVLNAAYIYAGLDPKLINKHEEYMHNAISWLYQVNGAIEFTRHHLESDKFIEIHFEDFYRDIRSVIDKLNKFLNLCVADEIADINNSRIKKWEAMDPRAKIIWDICANTAKKLGYEYNNSY